MKSVDAAESNGAGPLVVFARSLLSGQSGEGSRAVFKGTVLCRATTATEDAA